jgi:hypothetical protein
MKRLVILATKFSNTPEAEEVFEQRKWRPVRDESTIPKSHRIVNKGKHSTPLIDLEWEEIEYGEE